MSFGVSVTEPLVIGSVIDFVKRPEPQLSLLISRLNIICAIYLEKYLAQIINIKALTSSSDHVHSTPDCVG